MLAIPAIDLKDGKVVRLFQGKFDAETVYEQTAQATARQFEQEGARRIHVVDLDGALQGQPKNKAQVESIVRAVNVPVQLGGGIRELKQAESYMKMGVQWVIIGTKAGLDAGFLREAVKAFGERVIIGVDARDGQVAVDGWTKTLPLKAVDLAKNAEIAGAHSLIYTDISKDGALAGPNLAQIGQMCDSVRMQVIASGGIGDLKDIRALEGLKKQNLSGVVIGKALYEKKFSLKQAIGACS